MAFRTLSWRNLSFRNWVLTASRRRRPAGRSPRLGPTTGMTATTVSIRDGETIVTDGPFAETKEVLGGYYLVDVDSLERAQQLAAEIPSARWGRNEVRPLMELPEMPA